MENRSHVQILSENIDGVIRAADLVDTYVQNRIYFGLRRNTPSNTGSLLIYDADFRLTCSDTFNGVCSTVNVKPENRHVGFSLVFDMFVKDSRPLYNITDARYTGWDYPEYDRYNDEKRAIYVLNEEKTQSRTVPMTFWFYDEDPEHRLHLFVEKEAIALNTSMYHMLRMFDVTHDKTFEIIDIILKKLNMPL